MIQSKNLTKKYVVGTQTIDALSGVDFLIEKGEFVVIVGPSGSGKTTLLNLLGGMDRATTGELFVDGVDITKLNNKKLTEYRRIDIGFIFQFYNLMPNLTALENIELAKELTKNTLQAKDILSKVELLDRANNFPAQLSGGEQQRVSIARSLAKDAKLILCDEPTGALDYKTGKKILKLLYSICKDTQTTIILVTHNSALKEMADKVLFMKNGLIEKEIINEVPKNIDEIDW